MNLVPEAIFDQHVIVLGKTRSGKSSAMRLLVEHLLDKGEPVCIVDPKGDWWGLKSSADGKQAGYPLVIFGGQHGDVPLNARSGAQVAELTATENRPCIIDLGGWMPGERTQFWIDFASKFFILSRGRRWLVIDEAHNFCPKGKIMDPNAGKMLHWSNRLASEGLGKGIALIAASQRPQKVHNDFLTSCETLIAMRVIHAADRGAIEEWIDGCGDPDKGSEVVNTLASMKRGEAWVWSPEAEFGPKRLQFPLFSTYDSFRPQSAHLPAKLKGWADVDLGEVTKRLESVVREAEANDPAKLKLRIMELQKELKKAPSVKSPSTEGAKQEDARAIQRAVATATRPLRDVLEKAMKVIVKLSAVGFDGLGVKAEDVEQAMKVAVAELRKLTSVAVAGKTKELERLKLEAQQVLKEHEQVTVSVSVDVHKVSGGEIHRKEVLSAATPVVAHTNPRPDSSSGDGELKGPHRRILVALAQLRSIGKDQPPVQMVAGWAGYSPNSTGFTNPLGNLRSWGLVSYPAPKTVALTAEGIAQAGDQQPPDAEEIRRRILDVLAGPERKILTALLKHGTEAVPTEQLAEESGYSVTSTGFTNPLGSLRTKAFIEYPAPKQARSADWLFAEGL